MRLSERGARFLAKQERRPAITERSLILTAFEIARCPVFEPVVLFQERFGGLVLYAGLEPLVFGVVTPNFLHMSRENPEHRLTLYTEQREGIWYFECCTTLYQLSFDLDENGVYFEDGEPVVESFDKLIESCAILDELKAEQQWNGSLERWFFNAKPSEVLSVLTISKVEVASDIYTQWWRNESLCIGIQRGNFRHVITRGADGDRQLEDARKRLGV